MGIIKSSALPLSVDLVFKLIVEQTCMNALHPRMLLVLIVVAELQGAELSEDHHTAPTQLP